MFIDLLQYYEQYCCIKVFFYFTAEEEVQNHHVHGQIQHAVDMKHGKKSHNKAQTHLPSKDAPVRNCM